MSSLYGRKPKPFEHKDIDEKGSIFKSQSFANKRKLTELRTYAFEDSEDEQPNDNSDDAVDINASEEGDYKLLVEEKVRQLTACSAAEEEIICLDDDGPVKENKYTRKTKALLKKCAPAKVPAPKRGKKGVTAAVTPSSPPFEIVDLELEDSGFVVPQLSQSSKSYSRSSTVQSSAEMSLNHMKMLAGESTVEEPSSSSSSFGQTQSAIKSHYQLKTRLNGNHERKWSSEPNDSFGKLRARFAAIYGLEVSDIKFQFDGEVIKDAHTPRSLDMEQDDDNMIDVTINKSLYDRAVETASGAERPRLKMRTRLNGSHERKWMVPVDDSFGKVRERFADTYGLKPGDVRFEFDGDTVTDRDTPKSLGMEDDNMIDAKVDKALFSAAVVSAEAKK